MASADDSLCGGDEIVGRSLLNGTFVINTICCDVTVDDCWIKWRRSDQTNDSSRNTIALNNVFGVTFTTSDGKRETSKDPSDVNTGSQPPTEFTVHYVNKTPSDLWKHEAIIMNAPSVESTARPDITQWITHIEEIIRRPELKRPQRLLVFVNPGCGGSQGVKIYEKKAAPLFKLAGIQTDVTITQNGDQVGEILAKCDLEGVDGIVSVGGDGSFMLCFNGLLKRAAADAGRDINDSTAEPVAPVIPVGTIPAGTANFMTKIVTNVSTDPMTATLHIIMGEKHNRTIHSVMSGGKLVAYGSLLTCYGFLGDLVRASVKMRKYLGKARYPFALAKILIQKRTFPAAIHFRGIPEREDCLEEQPVAESEPQPSHPSAPEHGWEIAEGSFASICVFQMDLTRISIEKKVEVGTGSPADFNMTELNVSLTSQNCPRNKLRKYFSAMYTGEKHDWENEYIHLKKAAECKFEIKVADLNEKTSCLNIDGEDYTLRDKDVHIRRHLNILPVFGAGLVKILGIDKHLEPVE